MVHYLKNIKKWFRPLYHGPYIFFLFLNFLLICCYSFDRVNHDVNNFKIVYDFFGEETVSETINNMISFSSVIGMQALCTAIIIFLYSKYGEGAHGIPSEFLIEYLVGKRTIFIYRITALFLPCIILLFDLIKWRFVAIINTLFMYIIICIYVILISKLMQRDETSKMLKGMLKKEILDKEKVYYTYIFEEISYGYLKKMDDATISLQTKRQIYQEIKSNIMTLIFNESNKYELNIVIKNIYEQIVELDTRVENINFIYMYDLVSNLLVIHFDSHEEWKLEIIDNIILTLDKKNDINSEEKILEILYFALICAIMNFGEVCIKNYLWYSFFMVESQRNRELTAKLFLATLFFLELVDRAKDIDECSKKILIENQEKIKKFLCLSKSYIRFLGDIKVCCLSLSLIGMNRYENILNCIKDIEDDLNNINNQDYIFKTIIGLI